MATEALHNAVKSQPFEGVLPSAVILLKRELHVLQEVITTPIDLHLPVAQDLPVQVLLPDPVVETEETNNV